MEKQLITVDYSIGVSPNSIVISQIKEWSDGSGFNRKLRSLENLKNNKTKGLISKKSQVKMKKAINWLIISSTKKQLYSMKLNQKFNFKVNFITLTIPPQKDTDVSEKKFKSLLNTWLTYHRKYSKLNNYVWKVEQHKDGRLHCHLLADTFIHHKLVRDSWNTILMRANLLQFHFEKYSNYSPPSTEIKSVKKVKRLAAYMVKYMCKSNKENPLWRGRVWSCSSKLSKVINSKLYISPDAIGTFLKPLIKSKAKYKKIETEPNAFGEVFKVADLFLMRTMDWLQMKGSMLYEYFKELIIFLRPGNINYRQTVLEYQIV